MRFTEADASVEIQRVVCLARRFGDRLHCRVGKSIARGNDESCKSVLFVQRTIRQRRWSCRRVWNARDLWWKVVAAKRQIPGFPYSLSCGVALFFGCRDRPFELVPL